MDDGLKDFELTKVYLRNCPCGALQYHPESTSVWRCSQCKVSQPHQEEVPNFWVLIKKKLDKKDKT